MIPGIPWIRVSLLACMLGAVALLAWDYRGTKADLSEAKRTIEVQKRALEYAEISRRTAIAEAEAQVDRAEVVKVKTVRIRERPDANDPAPAIVIDSICGLHRETGRSSSACPD